MLRAVLFAVDRRLARQVTGIPAEPAAVTGDYAGMRWRRVAARPRGGPGAAPPSVPGRAPGCDHRRRGFESPAGPRREPDGEHVISGTLRECCGQTRRADRGAPQPIGQRPGLKEPLPFATGHHSLDHAVSVIAITVTTSGLVASAWINVRTIKGWAISQGRSACGEPPLADLVPLIIDRQILVDGALAHCLDPVQPRIALVAGLAARRNVGGQRELKTL